MQRNQILDLPLSHVMGEEIALTLQDVLKIYTVGNFSTPAKPPQPAEHRAGFRHPAASAPRAGRLRRWLGVQTVAAPNPVRASWSADTGVACGGVIVCQRTT